MVEQQKQKTEGKAVCVDTSSGFFLPGQVTAQPHRLFSRSSSALHCLFIVMIELLLQSSLNRLIFFRPWLWTFRQCHHLSVPQLYQFSLRYLGIFSFPATCFDGSDFSLLFLLDKAAKLACQVSLRAIRASSFHCTIADIGDRGCS